MLHRLILLFLHRAQWTVTVVARFQTVISRWLLTLDRNFRTCLLFVVLLQFNWSTENHIWMCRLCCTDESYICSRAFDECHIYVTLKMDRKAFVPTVQVSDNSYFSPYQYYFPFHVFLLLSLSIFGRQISFLPSHVFCSFYFYFFFHSPLFLCFFFLQPALRLGFSLSSVYLSVHI